MLKNTENSLNINEYSIEDLLLMLDLHNPSNSEIKNKINQILNKPNINKDRQLKSFFINVYNKLINNQNKEDYKYYKNYHNTEETEYRNFTDDKDDTDDTDDTDDIDDKYDAYVRNDTDDTEETKKVGIGLQRLG